MVSWTGYVVRSVAFAASLGADTNCDANCSLCHPALRED